jgi:NADPH:quinone reductase-like Zn-dependent oxidoreductase
VLDLARQRRRYDLILESVGGPVLRDVVNLVAPRGLVVCFGNSSQAETTFSISDFYPKQAAIRGFYLLYEIVREPPSADLAHLAQLCVSGDLMVDVAAVADWTDAAAVLDDLRSRRVAGKAILRTRWDAGEPDERTADAPR